MTKFDRRPDRAAIAAEGGLGAAVPSLWSALEETVALLARHTQAVSHDISALAELARREEAVLRWRGVDSASRAQLAQERATATAKRVRDSNQARIHEFPPRQASAGSL